MPDSSICAVFLGYGVPANILLDANYNHYLGMGYSIIRARDIRTIILIGGHTNPLFSERSEAREMQRLLEKIHALHDAEPLTFILIDDSITSWDNIAQLKTAMLKYGFSDVVIFCEKSRFLKIRLICRKLLSAPLSFRINAINFDQSRSFKKDLKQLTDYFLTMAQCRFPSLHRYRLWYQRHHIARSH